MIGRKGKLERMSWKEWLITVEGDPMDLKRNWEVMVVETYYGGRLSGQGNIFCVVVLKVTV